MINLHERFFYPWGRGRCACGCGQETNFAPQTNRNWGWIKGVPVRFIRGHGKKGKKLSVETRKKLSEVNYEGPPWHTVVHATGCWRWIGGTNNKGYGHLRLKGKTVSAYRHYYEKQYGPIPKGMQLDHLCRNRACCNPKHMEVVTNAENCKRGLTGELFSHVAVAKITPVEVREIRSLYATGKYLQREIAEMFGIIQQNVCLIVNKKTWANI